MSALRVDCTTTWSLGGYVPLNMLCCKTLLNKIKKTCITQFLATLVGDLFDNNENLSALRVNLFKTKFHRYMQIDVLLMLGKPDPKWLLF